jgi:regulatory protein
LALRRLGRKPPLDPEQAQSRAAAHTAAVTWLARRDFASGDLRSKLIEAGYLPDVVEGVVAELAERGAVNDERYVEHYVSYHAGRGQGPQRIRFDLRGSVAEPLIEAALAAGHDWGAAARRVRAAKFGAEPPADWKTKARQARFLQYRGFSADHIRLAFDGDYDESELAGQADSGDADLTDP